MRTSLLLLLLAAPAFAQLDPEKGLATMKPGEGLQVELFAAEPMVINPTSMDIDPLGRVWITEAVNYRRKNFNRPILRKEGDRIQVLIDEKGEGKASKAVTFYQGTELYGPLSVCVIPVKNPTPQPPPRNGEGEKEKAPLRAGEGLGWGLRVLVAQSPDILEFTCKDASNPVADGPPKKFLTGFGGYDHDHGVHGLHLGPDGKLYFTCGDQGVKGLQSSDGKGRKFDSNKTDVQGGTVWRCDLDGKNLELIAHNFRNNYEACVDSFGEIWLSDNDDDGNQQTRICFVMPGGNYGYFPRGPGQSHWHEEQPGIVHKTLRTGFGSPTGIQFYEGNLLPKQYQNTLMHCDAGPRELRAFTRKPKGAGYELDKALMLTSSDNWFRPSDVCTAPDGSVFVCDWYDPGVGGHGMGDTTRGRVYRITPTGHKGYKVPEVKLETKEGLLAALGSPCISTRMSAIRAIQSMDGNVVHQTIGVGGLVGDDKAERKILYARAAWMLANAYDKKVTLEGNKNPLNAMSYVGVYDRIGERDALPLYLRILPSLTSRGFIPAILATPVNDLGGLVEVLTEKIDGKNSDNQAASRELVLLLSSLKPDQVISPFYRLAKLYDGKDIFYRAALNIACGTDPVRRDAILADFEKHFPEWNDKVADLVWELRPKSMMRKLEKLLVDAKITTPQKARIVDILATSDSPDSGKMIIGLLAGDYPAEVKARAIENLKLFLPTKWNALVKGNELKDTALKLLKDKQTVIAGLQLIGLAGTAGQNIAVDFVSDFATHKDQPVDVRKAALLALSKMRYDIAVEYLCDVMGARNDPMAPDAALALGTMVTNQANDPISKMALERLQAKLQKNDGEPAELFQAILTALAGSRTGTQWLILQMEQKKLRAELIPITGRLLRNSPFQGERNKAMLLFPPPGKLDPKKLPAIADLAKRVGSADLGKAILAKSLTGETQCLKCHIVNGTGGKIGPDLSAIGMKASKENLYESMLFPSKAIADQYLSWKVDTDDGQSIVGLLVGETETEITIRDANGKDYKFPAKGTEKKKQLTSIMPEGLIATLTEDDLVDVVEYLFTLRTDPPGTTPMK